MSFAIGVIIAIVSFNVGMLFMAFWITASRQSNKDVSIKDFNDQGIFGTCDRCGKRFNLQESEDTELLLCQRCFKEVQNNPNDEYLTKRVSHEEHSIQ